MSEPTRDPLRFRLYTGLELHDEELGTYPFGQVALHVSRSPAKQTSNEDSVAVLPLGGARAVLAVADGVGGHPGGEHASERALEALAAALRERLAEGSSVREAILSGFDRANHAVLALGTGGATTLVVVEVDGRHVRSYHVGDSAVLAFGGRGRVKLQTIMHSPVGYAVEAGILDEEDAMVHEDRHLISNVVGALDMHVGMSSALTLAERDTLVLGSDGLFDNLSTDEIVEGLRRGPLGAAAARLAMGCRERMLAGGHPDDLTLIALRPLPRARS